MILAWSRGQRRTRQRWWRGIRSVICWPGHAAVGQATQTACASRPHLSLSSLQSKWMIALESALHIVVMANG